MSSQKKTLEQMLLEFAGKPTASNWAKNYSTFMEHWEEIQKEHAKGWSYLMIYKTLKASGIFTFSYPSFTSYIRKVERRQEKSANRSQQRRQSIETGQSGISSSGSSASNFKAKDTQPERRRF